MNAPLAIPLDSLDLDVLLERALELPAELRELVAHRLWESLHPGDDVDLAPDQLAEIERRMDDLDAGRVQLLDGAQVLAELRAKVAAATR